MTRHAVSFRKADVQRAVSGAEAAGMKVGRVEIDPSTGRIILAAADNLAGATTESPFDDWKRKHAPQQ